MFRIRNCSTITAGSETKLKEAIRQQPTVVKINSSPSNFANYKSGVYSPLNSLYCKAKNTNTAMLAVGYGSLNGKDYWKVKGHYGSSWGQQGYIYIERNGDGDGICGILTQANIPINH